MKQVIFFMIASIHLFSQNKLTKDSFFVNNSVFPKDYKLIVGNSIGWRVIGRFNCYYDKVEKLNNIKDTLYNYKPFRQGSMFSKIKRNKIISKGDRRVVIKIIYVDNGRLITESKQIERIKSRNKKIKMRTLFRRVN